MLCLHRHARFGKSLLSEACITCNRSVRGAGDGDVLGRLYLSDKQDKGLMGTRKLRYPGFLIVAVPGQSTSSDYG
jgi:hypothetical protein